MQRYSRKRQCILDCLKSTKEHPSAEWIYAQLKPRFPNLSLATVYRNLARLKEEGLIRSMGTVMGQERFDANRDPHSHAICLGCGKIMDIDDLPLPEELPQSASRSTGFVLYSYDLQFSGLCPACLEKRKEHES